MWLYIFASLYDELEFLHFLAATAVQKPPAHYVFSAVSELVIIRNFAQFLLFPSVPLQFVHSELIKIYKLNTKMANNSSNTNNTNNNNGEEKNNTKLYTWTHPITFFILCAPISRRENVFICLRQWFAFQSWWHGYSCAREIQIWICHAKWATMISMVDIVCRL